MTPAEETLRELCAYYEWSEPPNMAAADALQAAADALKAGEIDQHTGLVIAALWKPFAAFDKDPPFTAVAETQAQFEDAVLADMERTMFRAQTTASKAHIRKLIKEQVRNFRSGKDTDDA